MTASKQNHIYVYDEDRHKIIIIDGETGEKITEQDDDVTSILKFLKTQGREHTLRKFAVWCAYQTNDDIKPLQHRLIKLAEKAIQGEATKKQLKKLYNETEGAAIATDTVGLRQGSEKAPAFLATRECINPNAYAGAMQAARFHRLWQEMNNGNTYSENILSELNIELSQQQQDSTGQKQVNVLLDLIGER